MFYLVPVPKQFVDFSGVPYSGGSVTVYVHGPTEAKAQIYAEADSSVLMPNPCQLDSNGAWKCFVPADTPLDYIVRDKDGNVVESYMNVVMPLIDTAVTRGYVDGQDQLRDKNFAQDYDPSRAYPLVSTYVMYEGRLYRSAVVIDEPEEWNEEHWTECNVTDEMKAAVSAETSRAQTAEASARTEVVQGENCTIEKTTAADGHDVYTVSAHAKPQVQSDWNQADSSAVDYIKNKPANLVQDANYVHTDNNYTGTEKAKLAGVESGAQVNVIEKVNVNGTEQSVTNKAVDISVPTSSNATPLMDGAAAAGVGTYWTRGDHRHPTDTSREAVINKKQTIDPTSETDYGSSKAVAGFVNSSVATNTANFLGNFSLADLGLTYPATNVQIASALNSHTWPTGVSVTNNDYVYVEIKNPQTTGVDDAVERYKYSEVLESWGYEYTLNNSSFTAAEIAAIDSGITASDVAAYNNHLTNTNNPHQVTAAQVGAYVKPSGGIPKTDLASGVQTSLGLADSALQPSGDGSNVSVTPDGESSGTDIGNSTTLEAWAQKFKNLVASLGTAAFENVPSSGDASPSQVVMGNDSRLVNARKLLAFTTQNTASTWRKIAELIGTDESRVLAQGFVVLVRDRINEANKSTGIYIVSCTSKGSLCSIIKGGNVGSSPSDYLVEFVVNVVANTSITLYAKTANYSPIQVTALLGNPSISEGPSLAEKPVGTDVQKNILATIDSIPTVDQTFNALSTNPQSGTAVAQAVAPVNLGLSSSVPWCRIARGTVGNWNSTAFVGKMFMRGYANISRVNTYLGRLIFSIFRQNDSAEYPTYWHLYVDFPLNLAFAGFNACILHNGYGYYELWVKNDTNESEFSICKEYACDFNFNSEDFERKSESDFSTYVTNSGYTMQNYTYFGLHISQYGTAIGSSTTPVYVSSNGELVEGASYQPINTGNVSNAGTTYYKKLAVFSFSGTISNDNVAGVQFCVQWRSESNNNASGEGLLSVSPNEFRTTAIKGSVAILNQRSGYSAPDDVKFYVKRLSAYIYELWGYSGGWADTFARFIGGPIISVTYPNTQATSLSDATEIPFGLNADTIDGYHIAVGSSGIRTDTIYIV